MTLTWGPEIVRSARTPKGRVVQYIHYKDFYDHEITDSPEITIIGVGDSFVTYRTWFRIHPNKLQDLCNIVDKMDPDMLVLIQDRDRELFDLLLRGGKCECGSEATCRCSRCGKFVCERCLVYEHGKYICGLCFAEIWGYLGV